MSTPLGFAIGPILRCALVLLGVATLSAQVTESPHTIEPGKVLLEMDGLRLSYDRADPAGNKHTAIAVASTIVSAGITPTFDVQIGADLFLRETFELGGARDSSSGIGDVSFRMKWTFWKDEKRGAALAVIPYVRIPTSTGAVGTDHVEGGVIVPWALTLSEGLSAGAMFQWDHHRNDDNDGYDADWILSGYVQRTLTRRFSVYGELEFGVPSTGFSNRRGLVGVGAVLALTDSIHLDYELMRGLSRWAPDWTHVFRVYWSW